MVNVRNGKRADEFGMAVHKRLYVRRTGRLANAIGHINREKIRRRDKPIHRFEADMVGVHMIGLFPVERFYGRVRFGAQA